MDRKSNRLEGYDYSWSGYYFITQCVDKFKKELGNISNAGIALSNAGKVVKNKISWLENQYNYIKVDESVIMPNHVHMILIIDKTVVAARERPLQKYKSISSLMGAFKTVTAKAIHSSGNTGFKWQRSFWDHIIRNEKSYLKIKEYIINNPLKWELDAENPESGVRNRNKYYEEITGYVPPVKEIL